MKNVVKFYRLKKGWTRHALATISGLDKNLIVKLENETANPVTHSSLMISKALDVPIEKLFFLEPKEEIAIIDKRDHYVPGKHKRRVFRIKGSYLDTNKPVGIQPIAESDK